jgi:Icc-related predicted phosphoesterase
MRLVLISDTHCKYYQLTLPKGDVLVHCGDWEVFSSEAELNLFNNWLSALPFKYKVIIPGNHDCFVERNMIMVKETIVCAKILINEGTTIKGVKFWGSPYTPFFNNWSFMLPRERIGEIWNLMPKKVDVLITHGSPYGILDVSPLANGEDGFHVGDFSLLKKVEEVQPKIHCFGHIHFSYGQFEKRGTKFINCSVMNEDYEVVNNPVVVEI